MVNLYLDSKDKLWIGSDGAGLYRLTTGAPVAIPYKLPNEVSVINSNVVYAIREDRDGRMWIGTLRGGINLIEPRAQPFRHITYSAPGSNSLVDNFILSFCEDDQHNVYIGTDGAGLRYWNRQKVPIPPFATSRVTPLPSAAILSPASSKTPDRTFGYPPGLEPSTA
ncbi:ligand-binding sensor domain-containing protein [Paraflavitalea speifideaquila]|uniref:ligand-binding sensor domain-containing protein n=1 Tax=Paraflavitalea speifideaquila TaxID=3076558 RepID=UPI0028E86097|nr:two-component regulator propeller domain-containing protein [Paraflavitalea speifideiaquila]